MVSKPDGWYARNVILAVFVAMLVGAVVGFFLTSRQSSSISEPTPKPTLRAANCFDGTLEKGCPDFSRSYDPKPIKRVVLIKNAYRLEYEDGTTETITIEGR